MAINLVGRAPNNTYSSPGAAWAAGIGDVGRSVSGAVESFKEAKKKKQEEEFKKALEQIGLTGVLPQTPEFATLAQERYGKDFDPSTIKVSDFGRKAAGIQSDAAAMGLALSPEQLQEAQQAQLMDSLGLKTPEEQQKEAQDLVTGYFTMAEKNGWDGKPPETIVKQYEAAGWGAYPQIPGPPDALGNPTMSPAPILSAKKKKEADELQKTIDDAISLSTQYDWNTHGPKLPADMVPGVINATLANKYGPDWMETRPDVAQMVERTLQARGLVQAPEAPQAPAAPTNGIDAPIPMPGIRVGQPTSAPWLNALGPAGSAMSAVNAYRNRPQPVMPSQAPVVAPQADPIAMRIQEAVQAGVPMEKIANDLIQKGIDPAQYGL